MSANCRRVGSDHGIQISETGDVYHDDNWQIGYFAFSGDLEELTSGTNGIELDLDF